jgi:hypothetical protein
VLRLLFSGWCQIRLATDPDPFDDPAGVSGRTIALAGEPPFDRVIRFHDAVHPRLGAQPIGVSVDEVYVGEVKASAHPLEKARVDLLNDPVFEGRNGLVADDGREPILPFELRIGTPGELTLQREDPQAAKWEPGCPNPAALAHRFGHDLDASPEAEAEIGRAVCITDTKEWRERRRELLVVRRTKAPTAAERLGLDLRLAMLEPIFLGRVPYRFPIGRHGGRRTIDDPEKVLEQDVDTAAAWPIDFWFGAWDGDGLVAFVKGELRLPLKG